MEPGTYYFNTVRPIRKEKENDIKAILNVFNELLLWKKFYQQFENQLIKGNGYWDLKFQPTTGV